MSLLPSANNGSSTQSYFIENIGGVNGVPCIKGNATGFVRLGDPVDGIVFKGELDGSANLMRGGQGSGGSFTLGNSLTSTDNIVMTDGITTVNGFLIADGGPIAAFNGLSVSGDILLLTGQSTGDSISGYYVSTSPFTSAGGAVANPAGLTAGLYSVIVLPTSGDEAAQAAAVCYYTGTSWSGNGVSFNFTAGVPNVAIGPVAGGATLNLGGASISATGNVVFRKLMN